MKQPVVIKKYSTRRLYNTDSKAHTTLDELASIIRNGDDVVVYDVKTGEDITRSVLMHIVFEIEKKHGQILLPSAFLRQVIRFYGEGMQVLVRRYLELSIEALTRH